MLLQCGGVGETGGKCGENGKRTDAYRVWVGNN
jgi:hypothetical protein